MPESPDAVLAFNRRVVDEFRASGGRVGGPFAGVPLVLLTTTGARTGRPRTSPVVALAGAERTFVCASNAGADTHPAWFHNLLADPHVTVESGDGDGVRRWAATATPLDGAARERRYARQAALSPAFADYARGTGRVIPVVALVAEGSTGPVPLPPALGPADMLPWVHAELRRQLGVARAEVAAVPPGAGPLPTPVWDRCLVLCESLRLHHEQEEAAFPRLAGHSPAVAAALDRLDGEHRALAAALDALEAALDAGGGRPAEVAAALASLAPQVDAHFTGEEAELLPALATLPPPTPG